MVVGARDYGTSQGKVYLYFGSPDIDNIPDSTVEGEKPNPVYPSYGFSVKIADINGDGINDLTVGADRGYYVNNIWTDDGFIDIFYGGTDFSLSSNSFDQRLEKSNSGFESIQYYTLADINADGISDICYVKGDSANFFLGNSDSISNTPDLILTNPDTSFYSAFKYPCCFDIGDINNDGVDDCALRLNPGGYAISLIVYLGDKTPDPVAGHSKSFVSGTPYFPIVGLGDVDGDGVNDFGTCAPQNPLPSESQNGYFVIFSGDESLVTDVMQEETLPTDSFLEQNYPNPFNPTTTIAFTLPESDSVILFVYDILGREVIKLADGTYKAGTHKFTFNASNLASGVYIYRLQTSTTTLTKKMMLLK